MPQCRLLLHLKYWKIRIGDMAKKTKIKHPHRLHRILEITKEGYDSYSWIWWTISLSAIIGNSLFGQVGLGAAVVTFIIFFVLGYFHKRVIREK